MLSYIKKTTSNAVFFILFNIENSLFSLISFIHLNTKNKIYYFPNYLNYPFKFKHYIILGPHSIQQVPAADPRADSDAAGRVPHAADLQRAAERAGQCR